LALVAACSHPDRLPSVPRADTARAQPLGIANARFFADGDVEPMIQEGWRSLEREMAALRAEGKNPTRANLPTAYFLAVSGGGDNGAFGAGLLNGWSETGTRPEFRMVTGVSTGALIAPFAFLGPQYDPVLREVYTTLTPDRIFRARGLTAALFNDAMADTSPLADVIAKYADEKMFAAIAREYNEGRLLLIGTTDLDAQRPVIWNIGALAASGKPEALKLFHQILRASAAIPGLFQPVMIDVEIDGKKFQEMHVDGGTVAQLFLYPPTIEAGRLLKRKRVAYIIRNARLDPDYPWPSAGPSTSPAAPSTPCWRRAATTTSCAPGSSASATASTTTLPILVQTSRSRRRASSSRPTCRRSSSTASSRPRRAANGTSSRLPLPGNPARTRARVLFVSGRR